MRASVCGLMLSKPILTCNSPLRLARSMNSASLHKYEDHSADQRNRRGIMASINSMA